MGIMWGTCRTPMQKFKEIDRVVSEKSPRTDRRTYGRTQVKQYMYPIRETYNEMMPTMQTCTS